MNNNSDYDSTVYLTWPCLPPPQNLYQEHYVPKKMRSYYD
jgi:hypothetical protein